MELEPFYQRAIKILSNEGDVAIRDWAFKGLLEFDYASGNVNTLGGHNVAFTLHNDGKDPRVTLDELYHLGTPTIQRGLRQAFIDVANQLATNGPDIASLTPEQRATKLAELTVFIKDCGCFDALKPLVASLSDETKAQEIYGADVGNAYVHVLQLAETLVPTEPVAPALAADHEQLLLQLSGNVHCKNTYLPPLLFALQQVHSAASANQAPVQLAYRFLHSAVAEHQAFLKAFQNEYPASNNEALDKRIADDAAIERMLATLQQGGDVDAAIFHGKMDTFVNWCSDNRALTPPFYANGYMPFVQALNIGWEATQQFQTASPAAQEGINPPPTHSR